MRTSRNGILCSAYRSGANECFKRTRYFFVAQKKSIKCARYSFLFVFPFPARLYDHQFNRNLLIHLSGLDRFFHLHTIR